nr:MCP four helix bundle domain-containing protein [Desulforamulus aquiferis]
MLKNLKIRAKLLLSFAIIVSLVVFLGAVGYKGISDISNNFDEVSTITLPGVQALTMLKESQIAMFSTEFAMLNPRMTEAERQEQRERCSAAEEMGKEARAIYENLPKTDEELRLWNEFIPKFEKCTVIMRNSTG